MRRRVWVAKDSSRTTAGELQKIVESRGQKTLKPHVVREGFKKNSPRSSKKQTPASSVIRHDWNVNGTGFYGQMKQKMSFLAANTQDGFVAHRDKKYPMCTMKYMLYFWCCGPIFLLEVRTSCLNTWHHGFYQIPTEIKNQQVTDSVRNLIMDHVGSSNRTIIQTQTSKNNTKMGHWAQNQASAMVIPVLWPEPVEKWVKWTEERSTVMELWIWRIWKILDEGMVSDLLSGVL